MNEGNSLYYYANATFKPDDPEKLYNDLEWLARKLGYSKEELDRITI